MQPLSFLACWAAEHARSRERCCVGRRQRQAQERQGKKGRGGCEGTNTIYNRSARPPLPPLTESALSPWQGAAAKQRWGAAGGNFVVGGEDHLKALAAGPPAPAAAPLPEDPRWKNIFKKAMGFLKSTLVQAVLYLLVVVVFQMLTQSLRMQVRPLSPATQPSQPPSKRRATGRVLPRQDD